MQRRSLILADPTRCVGRGTRLALLSQALTYLRHGSFQNAYRKEKVAVLPLKSGMAMGASPAIAFDFCPRLLYP
jgi:hypothetical protein